MLRYHVEEFVCEMQCPFPRVVVNPTFLKLYPEFAKVYVNVSGLHLTSAIPVKRLVELTHDKLSDFVVPPYMSVPCGKCAVCASNRQQEWIFRLKQEMDNTIGACHFITLTYDDLYLPFKDANGEIHRLGDCIITNADCHPSLVKRDFQLFMKRLRDRAKPIEIRFFGVGEYGAKTNRPHYHVLLFGLPPLQHNFDPMKFVFDCWQMGNIDLGEVTGKSINYVTSYMNLPKEAPYKYSEPPFPLMSRRPGIGAKFIDSDERKSYYSGKCLSDGCAVCSHDGIRMPLPRYYKQKFFTDGDRQDAMFTKHKYAVDHPVSDYELHKQDVKRKAALIAERFMAKRSLERKLHSKL